ncbi:MAG: hypothetical protein M5U19_18475 [Microthrixaceae bacterium]|nr:hypothetical protein [Microthrixaceae bacterium]
MGRCDAARWSTARLPGCRQLPRLRATGAHDAVGGLGQAQEQRSGILRELVAPHLDATRQPLRQQFAEAAHEYRRTDAADLLAGDRIDT